MMIDLLQNVGKEVIISVIASIVLLVGAFILNQYLKPLDGIKKFWSVFKLMKRHVIQQYRGWDTCEEEIVHQMKTSDEIAIIKVKGNELSLEHNIKDMIRERVRLERLTRILLQSPYSIHVNVDVSKEFGWDSLEHYRNDKEYSLERLRDVIPNPSEIVRLYDFVPLLRAYIFDRRIYFSIYFGKKAEKEQKRMVSVWCLSRENDPAGIAKFIVRFFDVLWNRSHPLGQRESKTLLFNPETCALILPLNYKQANITSIHKDYRGKSFQPKSEIHITLIGSDLGDRLKSFFQKDLI